MTHANADRSTNPKREGNQSAATGKNVSKRREGWEKKECRMGGLSKMANLVQDFVVICEKANHQGKKPPDGRVGLKGGLGVI